MKLNRFVKECHEKGVFKMLSIYIVSSWVILQVLALISQPLGLPEKSITYLILLLLVGFPLYMFYIWKVYLVPFERQEIELDENGKWKKSTFQKMYYSTLVTIIVLSTFSIILIFNNNFSSEIKLAKVKGNDQIAVLKFENNTGIDSLDITGKMTSDWIIHGITENTNEKVISPKIVTDYAKINAEAISVNNISILKNYFNPKKIIKGEFYLNKGKLIFNCSITDGSVENTLISFKPIECNSDSPLDCIEQIKQDILTYLSIESDKNKSYYEETPPKFEAYQYNIKASDYYGKNDSIYINLINKAIEADSNYFEPKIHKISYYYNNDEFQLADSLLKRIDLKTKYSLRQQNFLLFYKSLLKGKNDKIYISQRKEYDIAYFDMPTNATTMVIAVQFVNRPQDIEVIFNEIPMDGMSLENCSRCGYRYYIKGLADIELKNYVEVIKMLQPITKIIEDTYLKKPLIMAYIKSGDYTSLDNYFSKLEFTLSIENLEELILFAGVQLLLKNQKEKANKYFNKIITKNNSQTINDNLAYALYYNEAFSESAKLFNELHRSDTTNIDYTVKLAISNFKNGNIDNSNTNINKLKKLRNDYQFGAIDYGLAQYYVAFGNYKKSLYHLEKSVAQGYLYTPNTFQNDPLFLIYKDSPEFQNIMTYWY